MSAAACTYPGCTKPPRPSNSSGRGGGRTPLYCQEHADLVERERRRRAKRAASAKRKRVRAGLAIEGKGV
jgi:hypothetical protein